MRAQLISEPDLFELDNPEHVYRASVRLYIKLWNDRQWNTEALAEAIERVVAAKPWKDTIIWRPGSLQGLLSPRPVEPTPTFVVWGDLSSFEWNNAHLKKGQLLAFERWAASIAQGLAEQDITDMEITGVRAVVTIKRDAGTYRKRS